MARGLEVLDPLKRITWRSPLWGAFFLVGCIAVWPQHWETSLSPLLDSDRQEIMIQIAQEKWSRNFGTKDYGSELQKALRGFQKALGFQFTQKEIEALFAKRLPPRFRAHAKSLTYTLMKTAKETKISPELAMAVIQVESSFRPNVMSWAGAIGLLQVVPKTGRAWAKKLGIKWRGKRTLRNPHHSIRIGLFYLSYLVKRFKGDIKSALIAYNLGPTRLVRLKAKGKPVPNFYYNRVLRDLTFARGF